MKSFRLFSLALLAVFVSWPHAIAQPNSAAAPSPLVMWYQRPAGQWVEALPIGNGRIGAMVLDRKSVV